MNVACSWVFEASHPPGWLYKRVVIGYVCIFCLTTRSRHLLGWAKLHMYRIYLIWAAGSVHTTLSSKAELVAADTASMPTCHLLPSKYGMQTWISSLKFIILSYKWIHACMDVSWLCSVPFTNRTVHQSGTCNTSWTIHQSGALVVGSNYSVIRGIDGQLPQHALRMCILCRPTHNYAIVPEGVEYIQKVARKHQRIVLWGW